MSKSFYFAMTSKELYFLDGVFDIKNKTENVSIKTFLYNWLSPLINVRKIFKTIPLYFRFLTDVRQYSKMNGAKPIKIINTVPLLHNKTSFTSIIPHYFYQNVWAFRKIYNSKFDNHVDVGSSSNFIGLLTIIKKTTFIDIRPLKVDLENFESKKGNILSIPFEDNSVNSLSCLHVAEHIGLGRYGDKLDPLGTKKAARELTRVLAPGGNLYFSLPIGKPRVIFNAHRIHSIEQILEYFSGLKLMELSGIDDQEKLTKNISREKLNSCDHGCGLFWFTKE